MTKDIIAFWGYPHPDLINKTKIQYPNATWIDLDICFNYPSSKFTPDAYCGIIKNIFDNAFYLKNRIIKILAAVGKDKCDSGFFAANLLKNEGFDVELSYFEDTVPLNQLPDVPICKSSLPLKDKLSIITANIVGQKDYSHLEQSNARFGFWGVPPNDLNICDLFPPQTHVFGWSRCVEAKNPANFELEMYVEPDLPTVFFAQTFCSKTALAKYLADKYNGLYIDVDATPTNSAYAKIEAFLRLR